MGNAASVLRHAFMERALSQKLGQEFEDFFSEFCGMLWGPDFERWKPQGRFGDFKCDGYLISEKTVFQCYAPERLEGPKTESKIRDSFNGAHAHFGAGMVKWCFVHNSRGGLFGTSNTLLAELREQHPSIEVVPWGPEAILNLARRSPQVLEHLFPQILDDVEFDSTFDDVLMEYVEKTVQNRALAADQSAGSNQLSLTGVLDKIAESDRFIRLRVMALCTWLEPVTVRQVKQDLSERGHSDLATQTNVERLCDAKILLPTKNHLLPLNVKACQEAAEALIEEFIERLS